jgi:hypothetical protein
MEAIMDLIGNIRSVQNRLGDHNPNRGQGKPLPKKIQPDTAHDQPDQKNTDHSPDEPLVTQLGRNIDTTA